MSTEFSLGVPVEPDIAVRNGLGVTAWRDALGRRLYEKAGAAALLGLTHDALHRRGVVTARLGKRAFVHADPIDAERCEILGTTATAHVSRQPDRQGAVDAAVCAAEAHQTAVQEVEAARADIERLESEVADLASDLRAAAAAEDVWKTAALRHLPSYTRND